MTHDSIRPTIAMTFLLAVFFWSGNPLTGHAEPESLDSTPHNPPVFLVSPVEGWNRDEMPMPEPDGTSTILKDTGAEYGLFLLYANPRLAVNNMVFYTAENGAKVTGDIFFLNLYGDPDAILTWNLGGGYTWHSINVGGEDMAISVPMAKAGIMIRWPAAHLSFNPYVAPAWEGYQHRARRHLNRLPALRPDSQVAVADVAGNRDVLLRRRSSQFRAFQQLPGAPVGFSVQPLGTAGSL